MPFPVPFLILKSLNSVNYIPWSSRLSSSFAGLLTDADFIVVTCREGISHLCRVGGCIACERPSSTVPRRKFNSEAKMRTTCSSVCVSFEASAAEIVSWNCKRSTRGGGGTGSGLGNVGQMNELRMNYASWGRCCRLDGSWIFLNYHRFVLLFHYKMETREPPTLTSALFELPIHYYFIIIPLLI